MSASSIARVPKVHAQWASRAHIHTDQEATLKVREEVKKLLKLSLPRRLFVELESGISINSADSRRVLFAQKLLGLKAIFANSFAPDVSSLVYDFDMELTDEPDVNNIVLNWISISDAFSETIKACASEKKVKEFEIRRGVDCLLKKSEEVVHGVAVSFKQDLRMRCSEALSTTSSNAVPDVVITSRMPTNLQDQLLKLIETDYEVTPEANWSGSVEDPADAVLLFGAVEYKNFEQPVGYHQLVYDLSTAQSVRKALGLEEETLYGWTSVKSGQDLIMLLYASWRNEKGYICISRSLWSCIVSKPLGSLAFYNFHCNYHKRNANLVKAIDDQNFEELATSLRLHCWRANDQRLKGEKDPSSDPTPSKKRAMGGSNKQMELKDDFEVRSSCIEDDGSGLESSSKDNESSEKNLSTSFELQTTKGVQRPLTWIAEHVEAVDFTTCWIHHHFEEGLITDEDPGVVTI